MVQDFLEHTNADEKWKGLILGNGKLLRRVEAVLRNLDWKDYVGHPELTENLLRVLQFMESNGVNKALQDSIIYDVDDSEELMATLARVMINEPKWQGNVGAEKAENLLLVVRFLVWNGVKDGWQNSILSDDGDDGLMVRLANVLKEEEYQDVVGAEKAENLLFVVRFLVWNGVEDDWHDSIISEDGLMARLATVVNKPKWQVVVGKEAAENLLLVVRYCGVLFGQRMNKSKEWLDRKLQDDDEMAKLVVVLRIPRWQGVTGQTRFVTLNRICTFLNKTNDGKSWLPCIRVNDDLIVRLAAVLENWNRKDGSCIKQNFEIIMRVLYFLVSNGIKEEIQDRILYNLDLVVSLETIVKKPYWQGNVANEKVKNLLFVVLFSECNDINNDWLDWIILDDNRMGRLANIIRESSWEDNMGKDKAQKILLVALFLESNNVKRGWQDLILYNLELAIELGTVPRELGGERVSEEGGGDYLQDGEGVYVPGGDNIFKAFSYAEPDDIKVVIIGTSPIPDRDFATGLAFSIGFSEEGVQSSKGHSIWKVHNSLKIADILSTEYNYDCSHEEWARNGVLLLNAALTITEGNGKFLDMDRHCRKWKTFMKLLLKEWIAKRKSDHKVFVMCWGYANLNYTRYADEIWRGAMSPSNDAKRISPTSENLKNLITLHSDHPTWPREPNNIFLHESPQHFQMINECYPGIFDIAN